MHGEHSREAGDTGRGSASTATCGSKGSVEAGLPAEYGEMLRMLTETFASGMGSRPNTTSRRSLERRRSSSLASPGEPRRRGHRRGPS